MYATVAAYTATPAATAPKGGSARGKSGILCAHATASDIVVSMTSRAAVERLAQDEIMDGAAFPLPDHRREVGGEDDLLALLEHAVGVQAGEVHVRRGGVLDEVIVVAVVQAPGVRRECGDGPGIGFLA